MAKVYKGQDLVDFAKIYLNAEYADVDEELSETSVNPVQNKAITTSGAFKFAKSEYEKSKNKITFGYGSGNNEYSNGTNSTLDNNKVILTGTPTESWANMSSAIEKKIDVGNYVLSVNKAYSFSFAMAFNHADGTSTTGYIYKGNISNKVEFTKEVISYRIYLEDLVVGQSYNETVEVQLESGDLATDVQPYNGEIIHKKDIEPVPLWKNATPNVEFTGGQNVNLAESVTEDDLIAIVMQRVASIYGGRIVFFVKPLAGGSIPCSCVFTEGGSQYILSRTITFYNYSSLYFENGYINNTENNGQMIPVAIYKYKH